jgi:hypothetical protein
MVGTNQVRHCQQCNQRVYNLSDMSRKEAEALIRNKEGRLCGRFFRRSDGTVMTRDCPYGMRSLARPIAWVLGIAAALFFVFGAALFAARSQSGDPGQPGQSAWEFIRSFFEPAPPPRMIMGDICPVGGPDGNPPAPPVQK